MESDIQQIQYEAGNPEFRGKTTIEIKNNLTVTVKFEQNNHVDTYSDKISKSKQKRVFEMVNAVNPCARSNKRNITEPDDIRVHLKIEYPHQQCIYEFWGSERFEYKPLNELIQTLNQLAATTSGGAITY